MRKKQETFDGLSKEEIEARVEQDIRSLARKWVRTPRVNRNTSNVETAATETCALYLASHHVLYATESLSERRNLHAAWMQRTKAWFVSEARPAKGLVAKNEVNNG